MAVDEHTLDGKQIAREENENELTTPVRKRSGAADPSLHQSIDVLVVGARFDQRLTGRQPQFTAPSQRRNFFLTTNEGVQKLRAVKREASRI